MKQERKTSANIALHQSYSGPIPDPESLSKYEQIQPGFAERIMQMAEKEAEHRRSNENRMIKNATTMAIIGVVFAFVSVLMFCGLLFFALMQGYSVATLGLAIGAIASVAGVFIVFRNKKKA